MKFPPEFDRKVDMRKVNLQVMRPWITKKVVELVGFEDEVVVEYAMGLLEDQSKPVRFAHYSSMFILILSRSSTGRSKTHANQSHGVFGI